MNGDKGQVEFGILPTHVIHHYRLLNLELSRLHSRIFAGTLMERGVGKLTALAMIYYNEGINQISISQAIDRDKAAVARILRELEDEGLIRRDVLPHERRSYALKVTATGMAALEHYKVLTSTCEEEFIAPLEPSERVELLRLLRKLRSHHCPDAIGI